MDLFDLLQNHIGIFLLVLTRISGIFVLSPFFGSMNVPARVRVGAAFFITILVFPVINDYGSVTIPDTLGLYAFSVLSELLAGWTIGFVSYLVFSAVNLAGQLMDMQVGFSIVSVMDPTSGQQVPLIGSFLYNLCLLIFLVTNGHYIILKALVESFSVVPLMSANFAGGGFVYLLVKILTGVFIVGIKLALPVLFAILLTNIGLGVLARTMPQMNIFVVGIPAQIVIGIFVLGMMLPLYVTFLGVIFNDLSQTIAAILQALA